MDFWMCADGREVLLKDIMKRNVSLDQTNRIFQKSKNGDSDVGDFMIVTDLGCYWRNDSVDDFFSLCW